MSAVADKRATDYDALQILFREAKTENDYRTIIELGSQIDDTRVYLALAYSYLKINDVPCALDYFDKWDTVPFDEFIKNPPIDNLYFWQDWATHYEQECRIDRALECTKKYLYSEFGGFKIVATNKKMKSGKTVKHLSLKAPGCTADFYYPFLRLDALYLKMGTRYAIDYWKSLRESPYYEDNSEFKTLVENGIKVNEEKQAAGYVYKPATKANREKFLAYAKERGWR